MAERSVHEQDAGDQGRVDDVVAGPGFGVVLEESAADAAHGGGPAGAVAGVVVEDEVGGVGEEWAVVDRFAREGGVDGDLAGGRVGQTRQGGGEVGLEPLGLVGGYDAVALAAGEVEVEAGQAQGVGFGLGPVDGLEEVVVGGGWLDVGLELEQAVVPEPGVEFDAAAEGVEAMVGEGDEEGLVVGVVEGECKSGIGAAVLVLDGGGEVGAGGAAAVGGVVRFAEPPEEVLDAVGGVVEDVEEAVGVAG